MLFLFFFKVYDGYGATEVGAISTDGVLNAGVDFKLLDLPEMGYLTSDSPPRGEICVRFEVLFLPQIRLKVALKRRGNGEVLF